MHINGLTAIVQSKKRKRKHILSIYKRKRSCFFLGESKPSLPIKEDLLRRPKRGREDITITFKKRREKRPCFYVWLWLHQRVSISVRVLHGHPTTSRPICNILVPGDCCSLSSPSVASLCSPQRLRAYRRVPAVRAYQRVPALGVSTPTCPAFPSSSFWFTPISCCYRIDVLRSSQFVDFDDDQ